MSASIAVIGTLSFPAENIPKVLLHLKTLVEATLKHDNCLTYDVALDPFAEGVIRFSELWPDRQSLDAHLQAAHIAPWRQEAKRLGLQERQFMSYEITGVQAV